MNNDERKITGYRIYLLWVLMLVTRILGETMPDDNSITDPLESQSKGDKSFGHSSKIYTRNNSPALNHFLEDVLNSQEELKWIDRAVHRSTNSNNFQASSDNREKIGNGKKRREYNEEPRKSYKPQRIYLEDEIKTKREIERNENSSLNSLASLKRTIIELNDSLNPREYDEKHEKEDNALEFKRKLLWSENMRSAIDVAIEYYDYEDGADSADVMLDNSIERESKREDSHNPLVYPVVKTQIPKKDENSEEERKEELEREKLKNKNPKEEFISDTEIHRSENVAPGNKNLQDTAPSFSNSLYNPMILKRIPAAPETEDSDFYTQCKAGSLPDESETLNHEENPMIYEERSLIDSDIVEDYDKPHLSVERTYLVISPSLESKGSRKRSVDPLEMSSSIVETKSWPSSNAEKSARNYFALKITDDMFKGGVEQSNPLGEDKPIESTSFSSFSSSHSSASGNSLLSLRSYKTKTTSPEWKVIEAIEDTEKKLQPDNAKQSKRIFGRHLTQIINEDPSNQTNFSSTFPSSSIDNLLNSTTPTQRYSSSTDIDKTTHQENTLGVHDSSSMNKSHNNARLRRHVDSFDHEDQPKRRKNRIPHENVREGIVDRGRMSIDAAENDSHKRKLTLLLASDNIEDESQIDLAVHGELAGKIVERIFEEVERNEDLKVALGPGLYRKHKPQESIALDKMYRQGLDEDEIKETETMMRRVMELLGRLVLDEVRRKTCASLSPDLHDFLQWSLGLEELSEPLSDQVPPLPMIPGNRFHEVTERPSLSADKFLFQGNPNGESLESNDLSELERKVTLLKSLINEYRALTEREKTKVQTVHDYLVRQLALLMKYIETKEAANQRQIPERIQTAGARLSPGRQHILQYQASVPNRNLTKSQENEFNVTNNEINDSNNRNPTFNAKPSIFSYFNEGRGQWNDRTKGNKQEPMESIGARRERNGKRSIYDAGESLEYRKLLRQMEKLRRKKREDSWGYEIPKIYNSPIEFPSVPRISLTTITDLDQTRTPFSISVPTIDSSMPVRGKNRLEDEVLLLNKREAWKKENERLLEEVAFGKDITNDFITNSQQHLFNRDEEEIRMKREFITKNSTISSMTINDISKNNVTRNFNSQTENLRSIEKKINVFPVEN